MGFLEGTEIYDSEFDTWAPYRALPATYWLAQACMVQLGSKVYMLSTEIEVLDLETWDVEYMGDIPEPLQFPGLCSVLTANGVPGWRFFRNALKTVFWSLGLIPLTAPFHIEHLNNWIFIFL